MKKLSYMVLSVLLISFGSNAFALTKTELDKQATVTFDKCKNEIKGCKDITSNASGVLVFPEVTKGGIGIAYESGKGALFENGKITGYYKTSAASLGATVGVGSKSVVIVLRTPEELNKFKKSSGWDVGADAGFAMLNTGAGTGFDTTNIKESVVGIVFGESGVLADMSIKGSSISTVDAKDLG